MTFAFTYVSNKGIMRESDYLYQGQQLQCRYDQSKVAFVNKSWWHVTPLCNSCLKTQVAIQPVSVAIDAQPIMLYTSGIYNGACNSFVTDHGVLVVGYGTENGADFWKVKNSWGASWGDAGYFRLARTDSIGPGICGIATKAAYPTA